MKQGCFGKCYPTRRNSAKTRIAILPLANISNLQSFVIRKSVSTRRFKYCNSLPVMYANNRKSWMTRDWFCKWLKDRDYDLQRSGHNVCCRSPPLDQGIICFFKAGYWQRLASGYTEISGFIFLAQCLQVTIRSEAKVCCSREQNKKEGNHTTLVSRHTRRGVRSIEKAGCNRKSNMHKYVALNCKV